MLHMDAMDVILLNVCLKKRQEQSEGQECSVMQISSSEWGSSDALILCAF